MSFYFTALHQAKPYNLQQKGKAKVPRALHLSASTHLGSGRFGGPIILKCYGFTEGLHRDKGQKH